MTVFLCFFFQISSGLCVGCVVGLCVVVDAAGAWSGVHPALFSRRWIVLPICTYRATRWTSLGPCSCAHVCPFEGVKIFFNHNSKTLHVDCIRGNKNYNNKIMTIFNWQVIAESLAMIAKCLITVVMVVSAPQWGLYIFSAAQVCMFANLHICYVYSALFM